MSSGSPCEPGAEARRRQQLIELHRQREAILRREERLEIEHADLRDRRRLHLRDQRRQVEIAAGAPALA